ncbi:uncharacterized protein LOC141600982 [Silene latifolia]|uniref:uncharacterized protein LOC141600982 n=1 Tax=Silene latifolia TaxID=37657 RepID=UPI003D7827F5
MAKGEKLNPYFLSTSNKSRDKLIVVELKGDNYDKWSVKLRGAMRSKKMTGFIDGTIKKQVDDIEVWYMVNAMIINWIFNVIEPSLGSTVSYVEEEKQLWDDSEQRFSIGNGPTLHRIKGSIHDCKQGSEESITDYYGRLKRLWDDLDKYDRHPTCNCGGYKCGLNQQLDKKRARYVPPVAALRTGEVHDKEGGSQRPYCEKCNKYRHVIASYFDIIGYPKGWRDRSRGGDRGGRGGRGGSGTYGFGQDKGNTTTPGNANIARVNDEAGDTKDQYVNVPKEQ